MPKPIFLSLAFLIVILFTGNLFASEDTIEKIEYAISPLGVSEYNDMGLVDLNGAKVNLVIFKTNVTGFRDTEKIYSEPATSYPLRVERDVSMWFLREIIIEEYTPKEGKLSITKFEGGKKTEEHDFQSTGPIHNAILMPFSLRKVPNLKIGWTLDIRLPQVFKVKLVSIEEVGVPAGKFKTFHFTSTPHKFEIWITCDSLRLPVKIKGAGGFSYTLEMKKRSLIPKDDKKIEVEN